MRIMLIGLQGEILIWLALTYLPTLLRTAPEDLPDQLQSMVIWTVVMLVVSLISVVPVDLIWRVKRAIE